MPWHSEKGREMEGFNLEMPNWLRVGIEFVGESWHDFPQLIKLSEEFVRRREHGDHNTGELASKGETIVVVESWAK